MKEGYYWYRECYDSGIERTVAAWKICFVKGGYVHFFGQVSQEIGNLYLTKYVEFGERIAEQGG